TLTSLNFAWNEMGNQGAQYLADALKNNRTLRQLDLCGSQIYDLGAEYLFDALTINRVR
ncbi:unnamed protein product, partial [Rotaria sp. Silwood1]